MPERNRRTLKLLLPLGVLALVAVAWRKGNRPAVVESVRTPMSEPVTDPTPPPLRTHSRPLSARRLALVAAYTTLFFAGAAFTAVAGDQSVGLPEEDAAWTQETAPAPEATPEATPDAPRPSRRSRRPPIRRPQPIPTSRRDVAPPPSREERPRLLPPRPMRQAATTTP